MWHKRTTRFNALGNDRIATFPLSQPTNFVNEGGR